MNDNRFTDDSRLASVEYEVYGLVQGKTDPFHFFLILITCKRAVYPGVYLRLNVKSREVGLRRWVGTFGTCNNQVIKITLENHCTGTVQSTRGGCSR